MKLYELLGDVNYISTQGDTIVNVRGIEIDSRKVKKGDLFVCLKGGNVDSHKYVSQAIARGAVAIVASHNIETVVPVVLVEDTREAYALLSANFFNNPAKRVKVITVTGTNGKTTTTYILKQIFETANYKCGVIGTNGVVYDGKVMPASLTTPDPFELNKILNEMIKNGVEYVFMEASAHAIHYKKLLGIRAEMGIFTNVSQDHLDFFKTMDKYIKTKVSYFKSKYMKMAIINSDDENSATIRKKSKLPCLSYGLDNPADVFAINYQTVKGGSRYIVNLYDDILEITTPLYGKHNLYNALAAMSVAKVCGISNQDIIRAMRDIKSIDGRFNVIESNNRYIVIDYAHSSDSLSNLLITAKTLSKGNIISVFGCGGDRDKAKRPLMGIIAGTLSDYAILTSDNPRYEEPESIIADIVEGIKTTSCEYTCICDRQDAIKYAINISAQKDIIVIAGKGAETYISIKGENIPYSDAEAVQNVL